MTYPAPVPMQRCCPSHRDWTTLAQHLIHDFGNVPGRAIVDELQRARQASDFFCLPTEDALDCAELIVRYRVISATGEPPSSSRPTTLAREPAAVA